MSVNQRWIRKSAPGRSSPSSEFSGDVRSDITQSLLFSEALHYGRIGISIHATFSRNGMTTELTEEEMRRALFGEPETPASVIDIHEQDTAPEIVIAEQSTAVKKKKLLKSFTSGLKVTLRVWNEFEGKMHEIVHEADTLSSLVAEQEATKIAKKKFRFVEVISVKSM